MWQFSREGIFACRNICSILISAEALSMTCATRLLPSSPFNSEWNPALSLIRALYFPTCWPLCSIVWRSRDCKILILFLAMMNLIGDIWVYQLVNDQLTKETNNGWWFYLLKKVEDLLVSDGRWAEVIIMTLNDKTVSFELIVFRQNKKIEFMPW